MHLIQWYILMVVLGLILFGLELFVPGGVLGVIGGILLFVALVLGFSPDVFGLQGGFISAIGLVLGLTVYSLLLLRYLPHSPLGRLFTLRSDMKDSSAAEPGLSELQGLEGTAETDLRPGGIALLGQRRVDVVADGDWVAKGTKVKVVEVEGNRVVVAELAG